jgi:uncharacterized phiE125 gp8 family phage protein
VLILQRIVPPSAEPVSLATAKSHCRVDGDGDDDLIALYISAAREYAEKRLNRALMLQTWRLSLDTFPWGGYRPSPGRRNSYEFSNDYWSAGMSIMLPRPPLVAISSIMYLDSTGTEQTLDPSLYIVDEAAEPARVVPSIGSYWPYLQAYQPSGVQVTYTAGYGIQPSSVPADIQLALLMLVGHYYENREASSQGLAVMNIPLAVDALLDGHGVTTFCYEGS